MNRSVAQHVADNAHRVLREHAAGMSQRLRALADDIDAAAERDDWSRIIHIVAWGAAQLDLDGLARAMSERALNLGRLEGVDTDATH